MEGFLRAGWDRGGRGAKLGEIAPVGNVAQKKREGVTFAKTIEQNQGVGFPSVSVLK